MYKDLVDSSGEYNTPKYLFNYLHKHFKFELDPCTDDNNWLGMPNYFTKETDGLKHSWPLNAFVNPPYGSTNEFNWIDKSIKEYQKHGTIVFVLMPSKTEAIWFKDAMKKASLIIFPQKRINFVKDGRSINGNTMGSVIFGFFRRFEGMGQSETEHEEKLTNFVSENLHDLDASLIYNDERVVIFPDRDILKEHYSIIDS